MVQMKQQWNYTVYICIHCTSSNVQWNYDNPVTNGPQKSCRILTGWPCHTKKGTFTCNQKMTD